MQGKHASPTNYCSSFVPTTVCWKTTQPKWRTYITGNVNSDYLICLGEDLGHGSQPVYSNLQKETQLQISMSLWQGIKRKLLITGFERGCKPQPSRAATNNRTSSQIPIIILYLYLNQKLWKYHSLKLRSAKPVNITIMGKHRKHICASSVTERFNKEEREVNKICTGNVIEYPWSGKYTTDILKCKRSLNTNANKS